MHRLKMRPILLTAVAALIGIVALVFGLIPTTNNAQATAPDDGAWHLIGAVTIIDEGPNPLICVGAGKVDNKNCHDVIHGTITGAKTSELVKGALVVLKSNPVVVLHDYPVRYTVIAYKAPDVYLQRVENSNTCALPAGPTGAVPGSTTNLYTGTCPKIVVGTGNAADLSGVSDIVVDGGLPAYDLFHCISRTDIDNTGAAKSAAVCFDNTGALGQGDDAEPIAGPPGEGPNYDDAGNGGLDCSLTAILLQIAPLACVGPPPPPPWSVAPPAKGTGTYDAGTDTLVSATCFPDIGDSVNIISILTIEDAHFQLATTGKQVGSVLIYGVASLGSAPQSNAACNALTPSGPVPAVLGVSIYPATNGVPCPGGDCVKAPFRLKGDVKGGYPDWDKDGCDDADELWETKPNSTTKCGDDPWNQWDYVTGDVSGSYDLTAIAKRQDAGNPGFYYDCRADIQQGAQAGPLAPLTARLFCYIDAPGVTVNAQASLPAGAKNCLPVGTAALRYCGDGISGAAPPGVSDPTVDCGAAAGLQPCRLFADIDLTHTELTGVLDKDQNVIKLRGCFEDTDGFGSLGYVYVDAIINAHTGHGEVIIWILQTPADCTGDNPQGALRSMVPVHIVRQNPGPKATAIATSTCAAGVVTVTTTLPHKLAPGQWKVLISGALPAGFNGNYKVTITGPNTFTYPKSPCPAASASPAGNYGGERDSDGDGCSDKKELRDNALLGGLRDPGNSYDYMNPTKDKVNRVDDILAVVAKYQVNDTDGNPGFAPYTAGYNPDTDRGAIIGGNAWNLREPNGLVNVPDILAAVKSYHHDCNL